MTLAAPDNIVSILDPWPDGRVALIADGDPLTYGALRERIDVADAALGALGVVAGARVALEDDLDPIRFITAWFAIARRGGTVVPIPRGASDESRVARIEHARCALRLGGDVPLNALDVSDEQRASSVTSSEAPAMILYTSGTTAAPRGAMISHTSLLEHTAAVSRVLGLSRETRALAVLPITHSFGIRITVLAPLMMGGCALFTGARFDADAAMDLATRERATFIAGVPTMFHRFASTVGEPSGHVRCALSAGAPLTRDIKTRAKARLGCAIREGYGLTEATFSTIQREGDEGAGVGLPVDGVQIQIASGETGEILVRGPNVMMGYLDDPAATEEALSDGWLRTGDLGSMDKDGRVIVHDRIKDLILRGGRNIVPAQVEDLVSRHPSVRQVAVVGHPHEDLGEEIVAVIVAGPAFSAASLAAFVREHGGADRPRAFALVDVLPLGPSRKVLRRALRRQIASGVVEVRPLEPL